MRRLLNNLCPGCGADWDQLQAALTTPLEYVSWPNPVVAGGFMGKSECRVQAETIIARCDECLIHFGYEKGGD